MRVLEAGFLREVGARLFVACGAAPADAELVADELIEASLMGLDSHGVARYSQYVADVLEGRVKPGALLSVTKEGPTTAILDCGFNFGAVSAARMADIVSDKALSANVACVVSQNGNHIGRLGSWVEKVARRGLVCFGTVNSSKHGHFVVPWGGREGRLATNPLALAAPTTGRPFVMDLSTSMITEGKIRVLMHEGKPVPPCCIQDHEGNPVTDSKEFYGPPRGTILPFGSEMGYRGFALSLLVEILGGTLAGMASFEDLPYVNGLCLIALNPEAFCGATRFCELMDGLVCYIESTPPAPGFAEVVMPGTLEARTRQGRLAEGIPVAEETWQLILRAAQRVGISIQE